MLKVLRSTHSLNTVSDFLLYPLFLSWYRFKRAVKQYKVLASLP